MNPLLAQFLAEADELLTVLDQGVLRLERDPDNADLVNEVFRAAHTIKGSSGLFDFPELTRLVHAAEDLLDAVRSGQIALEPALTDHLFAAFDLVRTWLGQVSAAERLPATAGAEGAVLIARLRAPLGGSGAAPAASARTTSAPTDVAPQWLWSLGEDWLHATASWLSLTEATMRFAHYEPDERCFFQGEDPLHLVSQVPGLDRLVPVEPAAWPPADEYDEYASVLGFVLATRAGVSELSYLFRYVSEQVEIVELDADGLRRLLDGSDEGTRTAQGDAAVVRDDARPLREPADQERVDDANTVLRAALRTLAASDTTGDRTGPGDEGSGQGESEVPINPRVGSVVRSVISAARSMGCEVDLSADASPADVEAAIRLLLATDVDPVESVDTDPTAPPAPDRRTDGGDRRASARGRRADDEPAADGGAESGRLGARTLRVDQEKVDLLMDLVGELHVAKNAMAFLADAAEEEFGSRVLSRRLKDQYGVQHRLVEEMQAAVMDIRMLPLSVAFARFDRLVRDLGRRLDKSVGLVTEGADTMADKDVIEALGDPLMHLVRNCVDHGLETAAERLAAGKSVQGTVRLSAVSEGDAVVIEVADDGAGIDPAAMRLAAYHKGVISEEELESLSDAEAVNLVFRPGFSTAAEVSDVSGRGVGMDAVRASVERLGGTVTVRSQPGAGTVARLRMPLSMAVTQVMVVSSGGQRFGVPIDAVVETVRIPASDVDRVLHQDVVVLRDEVIPLVDLAAALRMDNPPAGIALGREDAADRRVLVIRAGSHHVGLLVEQFHREVEVLLKPMDGMLADHPLFSGTALLGDGLVLLVLNPKELFSHVAADA
ncbi:chemotaxis protein CheA [Pengzhenrongella sicca]|uniref:histidine kinase n=1 Tax=Pengzhenrongella sicca TaxID=2819238 RepID=A0A8A4ZIC1_9MICO|nr:chemotaxis protein CheA [Pengzhenrongella sicca]QTE29358.1 chemotaxis protein CheA [Pengzhenrongella sicca]